MDNKVTLLRFCREFHTTGSCGRDYFCTFAHTLDDNDRSIIRKKFEDDRDPVVCSHWQLGEKKVDGATVSPCKFGTNCKREHMRISVNPAWLLRVCNRTHPAPTHAQ